MAQAPSTRKDASALPSFDGMIMDIARQVPYDDYHALGVKLGFSWQESENILRKNNHDVKSSATEVLMAWKTRHGRGPGKRQELQGILEAAMMRDLASMISITTMQDNHDQIIAQGFSLGKCRQILANSYKEGICKVKIKPWEKQSLIDVNEIFTVVTMYKKDASETKRGEQEKIVLKGSVDDIFKVKVNGVPPKRIAIYAGAGKGKTTAVAKMAYDWANKSPGSSLAEVPLLFILRFRYMNKNESLGQAILSELLRDVNDLTPESLESFIREHQDLCWIILDGYDEYSGRISGEQREIRDNIMCIVKNKYLTQCRVAVTSRPHLEGELDDATHVYAKMEIEGFSTASADTYIDKFFVQDDSKAQELKDHLNQHEIIREFTLTPLFCLMVCYLWGDNSMCNINTITKLFDAILLFLFGHLNGKGKYSEIWFLKTKKGLGKVALNGLVHDNEKLLFRREDFKQYRNALDNGIKLGLITETESPVVKNAIGMPTKSQTVIEFFHKSAQEYLAAMYLSQNYKCRSPFQKKFGRSKLDRVIKLKEKCITDYENLLRFVAGTGRKMCVLLMEATLGNTFLDKDERFRIILDLSTEACDLEGDVEGLLGMFAEHKAVVLKSLTLYTVVGMKTLPDIFKSTIQSITIKSTSLNEDVCDRLFSCLASFSSLTKLNIEFSSVHSHAKPPPIPSVQRLFVDRLITPSSYSGLIGSLSGLKEIDVNLKHPECEITQIAAGLDQSEGEGVTQIKLNGQYADDPKVSAACMSILEKALRRTNRLQKILLLNLIIDEENLVRFVQQCTFISTMTKIWIAYPYLEYTGKLHSHLRDLHNPKEAIAVNTLQGRYRIPHSEQSAESDATRPSTLAKPSSMCQKFKNRLKLK